MWNPVSEVLSVMMAEWGETLQMSPERMRRLGWRPGYGDPEQTGRGGPLAKDLGQLTGWAHGDDPNEV